MILGCQASSDNASKLAASPAGVLYMVLALSTVFLTLFLESYPVYMFIVSGLNKTPLRRDQIMIIAFFLVLICILWYCCFRIPMRMGARLLWERELPNG